MIPLAVRRLNFKRINKRTLLVLLILLTVLLYYFNFKIVSTHVPNPPYVARFDLRSAKHLIENLCDLYNDKKNPQILGNMCSELCNKKRGRDWLESYKDFKLSGRYDPGGEEEAIENKRSGGGGGGGLGGANLVNKAYVDYKSVLVYEHRQNASVKFVLKSRKKYFLDVDTHMDFDFADKPIGEQLDFLAEYVESTLKSKFEIDINANGESSREWLRLFKRNSQLALEKLDKYVDREDLNYYIRLLYLDEYKTSYLRALETADKQLLARFVTNFVVLTGQDEYLFYKLFQARPGTLKIDGSCGHFYATEYVDNLARRVPLMTVAERKSLARQFLSLVHALDTAYLVKRLASDHNGTTSIQTTPIQFCDVKIDNFGIDAHGQLRIIDTDTAYPDSYIFRPRRCSSHDDCHFFDCKSYCEPSARKCSTRRVNNNLQAFCEKIFNNSAVPALGVLSGVLDQLGSNLKSEIESRLRACQTPGVYSNTEIPVFANESISRGLNILLQHEGL